MSAVPVLPGDRFSVNKRRKVHVNHSDLDWDNQLNHVVLKSVKLWAAPSTKRKKDGKLPCRTPSEVSRLYFFDRVRDKHDKLGVERHILTAVLWQHCNQHVVLPDGLSRHVSPMLSENLRSFLEDFDSWPSERDLECIDNALHVTNVDLCKLAKMINGNEDEFGTWGYPYNDDMDKLSDWLGCGDRNWLFTTRLWRSKVIAAAVLRYVFNEACKRPSGPNDASQFQLYRDVPHELLPGVLSYADASSLRNFASTSVLSKRLVRQNPEFKDVWRRNLFFARAVRYTTPSWDWQYMCAEDLPNSDHPYLPKLKENIFFGPASETCNGGFCREHIQGASSNEMVSIFEANVAFDKQWEPRHFQEDDTTFSFLSLSPFGDSENPTAMRAFMVHPRHHCVAVFAGHDRFGGFIGAGLGTFGCDRTYSHRVCENLQQMTVCGRYLRPGDVRLAWTVEHLLSLIQVQYATNTSEDKSLPWKSPLFNLDGFDYLPKPSQPIPKSVHTLPQPLPGFKLKLRLVCDLRQSSAEYVKQAISDHQYLGIDSNCCLYCSVNLGCSPMPVSYRNEEFLGLGKFICELEEDNKIAFCNNSCFLSWFSSCQPLLIENNTLWQKQCWGCGSYCTKICKRGSIYYEHDRGMCDQFFCEGEILRCSNFCSRACAFRALPEVLRFCREDWQTHPLTQGVRRLSFLGREPDVDMVASTSALELEGWKPDREGVNFWNLEDPATVV